MGQFVGGLGEAWVFILGKGEPLKVLRARDLHGLTYASRMTSLTASEEGVVSPWRSKGQLGSSCQSLGKDKGRINEEVGWERSHPRKQSCGVPDDRVSPGDLCQAVASPGLSLISCVLSSLASCIISPQRASLGFQTGL